MSLDIRERDVEQALRRMVEGHGGLCLKWVCPGWSGVPDRIILLPGGRIIFAEVKRQKGGRLSKLQQFWSKRLTSLGFEFWAVWDHYAVEVLAKSIERGWSCEL